MKPFFTAIVFACVAQLAELSAAESSLPPIPAPAQAPRVSSSIEFFDLAEVTLTASPFLEAQRRDHAYLLSLEPDRFLHTFRLNVGLPSSAQPYGGWESPSVELRGHSLGHYLSACALMYRSTRDAELKRRIDYIVAELAKCQTQSPAAGFHDGYLSAFPESFIDRVESGKEVWAPWYTLHKVMAGLLDCHQLAGSQEALDVLNRMAGWIDSRMQKLSREQMQASLKTEFGGMNEVLANLYSVTGNATHFRLAQAFDHAAIFDPLAQKRDALDGFHANTQIPKIIGAAREYELSGDTRYQTIAQTFWDSVALARSFVIGGHSDREHFFPITDFAQHLTAETSETCNTYNMLKLTRHLYSWDGRGDYMDFYERALYNHILASQDPAQGMFVYLMSLAPGHYKSYSTPDQSFWCCVGTGMENHAKYADTIYAHGADTLYVNLFIPSKVSWSQRGVTLEQITAFPESQRIQLVWTCNQPTEMKLQIRHPSWSQGPLSIAVNGTVVADSSPPGGYASLQRRWQTGDRIEISVKPTLHAETLPGNPNTVAILYGPIVLAGKLGSEDMPSAYVHDQLDLARYPDPDVPAIVANDDHWLQKIETEATQPLVFRTHNLTRPHDVTLVPFYQVHHERNTVYWQVMTRSEYETKSQLIAATETEWKQVQATALDVVLADDATSEVTHQLREEKSLSGHLGGRGWRQAQKGTHFAYTLNTRHSLTDLELVCAFGSRDVARAFSVSVDGKKIAEPKLEKLGPGEIALYRFPIPAELTKGKETLDVKFQADDGWDKVTANVFGCALAPVSGNPLPGKPPTAKGIAAVPNLKT